MDGTQNKNRLMDENFLHCNSCTNGARASHLHNSKMLNSRVLLSARILGVTWRQAI